MAHSNKPVSPLRQRMIEDMTMRKLQPQTQVAYIRSAMFKAMFKGSDVQGVRV